MNKEELKALIGKYIHIIFTLYSKKLKTTGYHELYGYIRTVEDKNILFENNYRHEYIVPLTRIKAIEVQLEPRRTEEEWQIKLIKEVNKAKETIRKKIIEIKDKEPLIEFNN